MAKKKMHYIKVTTSTIYAFDDGEINGWPVGQVIDDWFKDYPLGTHHATRDGHHVGNTTILEAVEELDTTGLDKHKKQINEQAEEIRRRRA